MVLRYFKKAENAPAQDETTGAEASNATTSSEFVEPSHLSAGPLPSTEVSSVAAQGHIERPVLTDEDENFLRRAVSEEEPPPLPPRPELDLPNESESHGADEQSSSKQIQKDGKGTTTWRDRWDQYRGSWDRASAADDLMSAAEAFKAHSEAGSDNESDAKQEQKEVKSILDRLDLSAINNRVVGVSKETQRLLESFNQVLKDIINGVPTAYRDLEKLLTDRQTQLEKLFGSLPPSLQKLVKSMPTKFYGTLAPQIAAAMATKENADKDASESENTGESKEKAKKKTFLHIPSLRDLVVQKGAVVAMLRSIISFLETRFPSMLVGTNVIMSLAVFVLLFVFWYFYKRGRETRLAREQEEIRENSAADAGGETATEELEHDTPTEDELHFAISNAPPDAEIEKKVELLAQEIENKP